MALFDLAIAPVLGSALATDTLVNQTVVASALMIPVGGSDAFRRHV